MPYVTMTNWKQLMEMIKWAKEDEVDTVPMMLATTTDEEVLIDFNREELLKELKALRKAKRAGRNTELMIEFWNNDSWILTP